MADQPVAASQSALDPAALLRANLTGALWMLAAALCFTLMGSLMKQVAVTVPVAVVVFVRMAVGLALLLPWILVAGAESARSRGQVGWHLVRAVFGAGSLLCFVYSVSMLPFATAVALAYTTPLWMIVTARLFLGETVGSGRALATLAGFAGVIVIVRPHLGVEPPALVALFGAFCGSVALMLVRKLSARDTTLAIVLHFCLFGTVLSAGPALLAWQTPDATELALLVAIGAAGALGLYASARAYRAARATVVTPVDFARLPLAGLIGWLVFAEIPDPWVIAGTAIIVAAVIAILRS